jgi:ribosomal-protein-alanine N-acetyltransferase
VIQNPNRYIRGLELTDIDDLIEVSTGLLFSEAWTPENLVDELKNGQGLGLYIRSELASFVLWRGMIDVLEISWLGTSKKFQRQGLMGALLGGLADANQQYRRIWLEVHEQNQAARSLYEGLGFKLTGKRAQYYSDGGAAILYTKDL